VKHYDYVEAAVVTGIPERWLRENKSRLPHRQFGKAVRFTEADLEEISDMSAVRPVSRAQPVEIPPVLLNLKPAGRARRGSQSRTAEPGSGR